MKPKTSVHCKSDRLRRAIQPASVLLKKKELKRLCAQKKTVRFNLSTKLSTSELVLSDNKAVDSWKPDAQQDQNLTSKSSVSIAAPRVAFKPAYKRSLGCLLDHAGLWNQLSFRNITNLRKCFRSFTDLYMWEPVFNLKTSLPVKGILKNTGCSAQFNNSCGSYTSHASILLAKDSFHDVSEKRKQIKHCHATCPGASDEDSMFDTLASSIQGLQISALTPAYLGSRGVNVASRQQRLTFPEMQPFPVHLPRSCLRQDSHGCVSFFGVDAGDVMFP